MLSYFFKVLQIACLTISLLNLNQPLLAQTNPTTQTTKENEAEITVKTIIQLNAERKKAGKSQIDPNNFEESIKDLSPQERKLLFNDLDRINVQVRESYGLKAARLGNTDSTIGVPGISEAHDKMIEKIIKEKSGITSNDKESENPNSAPVNNSRENSKVKIAGVDNSSEMMGSITMLAVGFIASRLFKYIMTTDIMVAAAGGAAYIVGEILSTNKFKEVSKDLEVEIKNNSNDKDQIEYLQKLKQSYQSAKEAAETKKNFQTAAAVAFTGAAAIAFFMKGLEITSEAATISALTLASTAAAAAAEAASLTCPVTSAGCLLIAPCTTAATTFAADVALRKQMNFARDTTIAPSMTCKATDLAPRAAFLTKVTTIASSCPPAAPVPAQVKAEDILINLNSTFTPDTSFADVDSIFIKNQLKPFKFYTQTPQPQINQNYFEKLIHFIMPSAQASTMNLLMGGAGAGAGILIGMVGTMGASVDTFMYASKNRGIMWGVLAGLSFGASKSTDSVISNIDNNIQKIDNILAGMNSLEKGVAIGNNNGSGALPAKNTAVASKQKVKLSHNSSARAISSNPADRISCFGSEGDSNCNSLSNQIEKLPDFKMLPPQLQSLSVDATKLVGGLEGNNKISGSTLGSVEDFGGKQSAVGKMLETSKGRVNKLLAKNKKGGINFAKEEGNVLNGFKNGINKSLRKTNTSPKAFLASIGSGFGNLDKSDEANNENERKSNSSPLNQATVYGIGDERVNGASEFSHKLGGEEFSTDNKDKSASATSSKSNVDNFDITTSDINTNSSQSLFELISARYFKSGYPRLFMKKEEEKVEK